MRIRCQIAEIEAENEYGRTVPAVCATCPECDHETMAYGTSEASVKRALVMLREECPMGESNYYVDDDD